MVWAFIVHLSLFTSAQVNGKDLHKPIVSEVTCSGHTALHLHNLVHY